LLDDKVDKSTGSKSKSVQFGAIAADNVGRGDYDLSQYLHKDEKKSPRDVSYVPSENITYRRKSGQSLHYRKEPYFQNYKAQTLMNSDKS
jgi:hypothetical protein